MCTQTGVIKVKFYFNRSKKNLIHLKLFTNLTVKDLNLNIFKIFFSVLKLNTVRYNNFTFDFVPVSLLRS